MNEIINKKQTFEKIDTCSLQWEVYWQPFDRHGYPILWRKISVNSPIKLQGGLIQDVAQKIYNIKLEVFLSKAKDVGKCSSEWLYFSGKLYKYLELA